MSTKPPTPPLEIVNKRAMERRQNRSELRVLNLRGMPALLMRQIKFVSGYRGITFKQSVINALEQYFRAEWNKIREEMDSEEEQRQKAQRLIDSVSGKNI